MKASDSTDVIRHALQVMLPQLIDAEVTAFIVAEPRQRTDARVTQRNGSLSKTITTAAGNLDLSITKLRTGSFFPSLLERRRRIDQDLGQPDQQLSRADQFGALLLGWSISRWASMYFSPSSSSTGSIVSAMISAAPPSTARPVRPGTNYTADLTNPASGGRRRESVGRPEGRELGASPC